jgi:hypothetical protein
MSGTHAHKESKFSTTNTYQKGMQNTKKNKKERKKSNQEYCLVYTHMYPELRCCSGNWYLDSTHTPVCTSIPYVCKHN